MRCVLFGCTYAVPASVPNQLKSVASKMLAAFVGCQALSPFSGWTWPIANQKQLLHSICTNDALFCECRKQPVVAWHHAINRVARTMSISVTRSFTTDPVSAMDEQGRAVDQRNLEDRFLSSYFDGLVENQKLVAEQMEVSWADPSCTLALVTKVTGAEGQEQVVGTLVFNRRVGHKTSTEKCGPKRQIPPF